MDHQNKWIIKADGHQTHRSLDKWIICSTDRQSNGSLDGGTSFFRVSRSGILIRDGVAIFAAALIALRSLRVVATLVIAAAAANILKKQILV